MNKTMEMIGSAQQLKLTTVSKPDISTLLRIGHFYFALTNAKNVLDGSTKMVLSWK
jgi:hypothetical protein